MKRWELERRVGLLLGESADSPFFGEPIWLRETVIDATDQVAREADAWYTYFSLDIDGTTTPVSEVCLPDNLYKPKVVEVLSSTGQKTLLREGVGLVTAAYLDRVLPNWKTAPELGTPRYVAFARPILYLHPRPNYLKAAAVTVRGFAVPGRLWDTTKTAPGPSDEFPLAQWAVDAVTYKAAELRCIQTGDGQRLGMITPRAREAQGIVNRMAGDSYSRLRKEWS